MISQKLALNNDIVLMRHLIRQVKVHIFHKLTKSIKNFRNRKGNEITKQKFEKKAEKLVEELLALKKFDNDIISKDILLEKRTANIILSDINSTINERVLAKVMTFNKVSEKIKEIREKYPESLIIEFLKSNKNRNKKNKKINKSNQKGIVNKEDEGHLNDSKKRKIKVDDEKETLTENDEEIILNKSKKKKLNGERVENGDKARKKENVGKQISNKLNRMEKTDIESYENDNPETSDSFFLMSNEDEENEIDDEIVSSKSKKKTKQIKSKEKERGEEKINYNKTKKRKEIQSDQSDNEESFDKDNISVNEIEMNKKSKENKKVVEESVDPFFLMSNGQDEYLSIVKSTSDDNNTVKQSNRTYTDNLNRKQRRKLQKNGGKVPKRQFSDRFSTNQSSFMNVDSTTSKKFTKDSNKSVNNKKHSITEEVQNLHPSWQAKLVQKPSVVQFQGKKIVFDET